MKTGFHLNALPISKQCHTLTLLCGYPQRSSLSMVKSPKVKKKKRIAATLWSDPILSRARCHSNAGSSFLFSPGAHVVTFGLLSADGGHKVLKQVLGVHGATLGFWVELNRASKSTFV